MMAVCCYASIENSTKVGQLHIRPIMKSPGAIEIQRLESVVIFHNLSLVGLPLTMLPFGNQISFNICTVGEPYAERFMKLQGPFC